MDFGESESVYNLIPLTATEMAKDKMYRSKHNPKRPPSYSTFGAAGTARTVANASGLEAASVKPNTVKSSGKADPKQFMKKCSGLYNTEKPSSSVFLRPTDAAKKPVVPTREDKPIMGLKTEKNFVVSNAVECILSVPKKRIVEPTSAVSKTTYGQVPKYIQKANSELKELYEANAVAEKNNQIPKEENLRKLSEAEVSQLLTGLKRRWEEVNKAFQTMSFSMETSTQIHRKDELEREMKILEDAMKKLDKRFLFVYNDSKPHA